ncbi:class I adenylate-forming enzyme family protein [Acerihabitans arboris]|uniref:AMP-binding protein n=1 Tax=Acerihabitans arboris TaxID=2691583 RepID=A0A845SLH2_9GAMM|nr:class I adenylate-forming enzyme family protein [Acerihabitans arboris]NDL63418.1 AMP-binding protein [Acerihabitans arboris]
MTQTTNLGATIDTRQPGGQIAFIAPREGEAVQEITFGELGARADAIGRALLARGYRTGERVAILGRNSIDYVASLLGILRAGLVAVPINFKFPVETLDNILRDSGARLLLGDGDQLSRPQNDLPRVVFNSPAADGLAAFMDPGELSPFAAGPDALALLLYTSGSTGMPKGVRLTHASHAWVVRTRLENHELEGERVLIAAPLYHMNALALALLTLASHVATVLLPQFNARDYINAITRYRCSWLTAVPPMIAMMLREKALLAQSDLTCVRVVRMGSAPVTDSLFQQIGQLLPKARIINAYGTTEGGPVVFAPHPDGIPTPRLAAGAAHPQVSLRLRDPAGHEAARGILELKSPGLMQGYHQRPDLRPPFTDDGYYITGDVFERDHQGFYTFIGRLDDMFVSGAENIYPSEVEHLIERHPAVQQACVVPVADEIKGTKPVAFVILRPGRQASAGELKAFTLSHGAAYLHPRHIWLVDGFPLAGTNKIDRRALLLEAGRRIHQDSASPQANPGAQHGI